MTHIFHRTKFRWTENLTCRFIQLRKENGKLFTGRKYSAQAGWEYILRQMQEEFPTIMADVHYGVLKKKWSNLLQQYKELRNPVHGDRNKADDVSWPFYNAIDEVLGGERGRSNGEACEEYIDPHEFLCVSVTPEEPTSPALPAELDAGEVGRRGTFREDGGRRLNEDGCSEISRVLRDAASKEVNQCSVRRKRNARNNLMSRLPRAVELSIERIPVRSVVKDSPKLRGNGEAKGNWKNNEEEDRPRKLRRVKTSCNEDHDSRMERRLEQFFEYTKRRDEENRSIMMRIMHAVEGMASKV